MNQAFSLQVFIPAGKTGQMQPLDVGMNRPFKIFWEEEYHTWRKDLTENDLTKAGYLRGLTRRKIIDMVFFCWVKVTDTCVQISFVKANILSEEDLSKFRKRPLRRRLNGNVW